LRCCGAISPRAIPVAAWPRWTSSISPTWSSRRRSPPSSIEYREPSKDGRPGRLIGACLTDQQSDGLSMVYSFFDPERPIAPASAPSSSSITSSAHNAAGLPYVYLGYWVKGSARMQYKTRFQPMERLGPNGWRRLDVADVEPGAPPMPGGFKFPRL
jgi:arginyl-tRNA--protein-N-Asp/Glu arginylyltransferase